eukprot:TRINITY_DN15535_c0_g1_i1.p1 TRINITY_DN15535_c0_g1~~TRINITY_DN15535_c0_g1_i1.p1  ORF type:complete len:116 (+),score=21.65 TRINITY_DN15535_c0_g1_i1:66-413(+)
MALPIRRRARPAMALLAFILVSLLGGSSFVGPARQAGRPRAGRSQPAIGQDIDVGDGDAQAGPLRQNLQNQKLADMIADSSSWIFWLLFVNMIREVYVIHAPRVAEGLGGVTLNL